MLYNEYYTICDIGIKSTINPLEQQYISKSVSVFVFLKLAVMINEKRAKIDNSTTHFVRNWHQPWDSVQFPIITTCYKHNQMYIG